MKRYLLFAITLVFFSLFPAPSKPVSAAPKDQWVSVQSKNFLLLGNASEKEIRRVGTRLEQFREVFAKLFPKANVNSPVPMRVIIFKNRAAYLPFMPVYQGGINEVAGYFQSGQDVNYITLTTELNSADPYRVIFHEYVHALLSDNTIRVPAWFNEGLAEYYSTFEITDGDRKVTLGKPLAPHVFLLRENRFLPLARLFAVDHGAPEYNERDKKGVFYAESWALVHYLMLGNAGKRQPQFIQYLGLLAEGTAIGEAFQTAFQTDYAVLEKELRDYISRNSYPIQQFTAQAKLEFDASMQSAPLSEAEAQYYLGDLLLHQERLDCEPYLVKALELDPKLALAHASLGLAKVRGRKFAEAKQHLQRAVELNTQNYLVPYYYAQVLLDELSGGTRIIQDVPEATGKLMREQLRKTIALAPAFADAYRMLAFVNLITNEELNEAVALLKRALQLTPGREELGSLLGQVYLRQEKYDEARRVLEPLAKNAAAPHLREQAQTMLDAVNRMAEMRARYPAQQEGVTLPAKKDAEVQVKPALRRRFEGEKADGVLLRVDCGAKGITLTVKTDKRVFEFHTTTPERLQFITYSQEVGHTLTCGVLKPAPRVSVTYRFSTDARSGFDGEPIAVEFVKEGN